MAWNTACVTVQVLTVKFDATANGNAAFMCKLCCHWPRGLQSCQIAIITQYHVCINEFHTGRPVLRIFVVVFVVVIASCWLHSREMECPLTIQSEIYLLRPGLSYVVQYCVKTLLNHPCVMTLLNHQLCSMDFVMAILHHPSSSFVPWCHMLYKHRVECSSA